MKKWICLFSCLMMIILVFNLGCTSKEERARARQAKVQKEKEVKILASSAKEIRKSWLEDDGIVSEMAESAKILMTGGHFFNNSKKEEMAPEELSVLKPLKYDSKLWLGSRDLKLFEIFYNPDCYYISKIGISPLLHRFIIGSELSGGEFGRGSEGGVLLYGFPEWVNIYSSRCASGALNIPELAATYSYSKGIVGEAKVLDISEDTFEVLTVHYGPAQSVKPLSIGEPIYAAKVVFDLRTGLRKAEHALAGTLEGDYYPIWPMGSTSLIKW